MEPGRRWLSSFGDRDYFLELRQGAISIVSKPIYGRITKAPVMVFARRLVEGSPGAVGIRTGRETLAAGDHRGWRAGPWALVSVVDSGPGIPAEVLPREHGFRAALAKPYVAAELREALTLRRVSRR